MDLLTLMVDIVNSVFMAGFLAYIAFQQLATNRKKLNFDLYIKRFEVYSVSLILYQELTAKGASEEILRDFIEKKESAKFLFSTEPSIYLLLNEMHKKSFKINAVKTNRDDSPNDPDLMHDLHKDAMEALKWFESAIKELSQKMEKFLNA
ncbi:conserved hypothetical protein [Vibrio aestuarianus]|uniref:hypothetical protein n=1 Tax=Vibrio aestuarianus TaxID=28171 RepID=UPI0014562389|nr:hypothetical protein [Vibrio aestuarianus]NLS60467.1 hypothetical protein [Vibrio aestuarianus subsp. francensis]CAH8185608.1 conserved hypothetical protein [Vibrio aestuarianus]CAH8231428.1 conserved hypothetical protein [Vibrio aestuarianus]